MNGIGKYKPKTATTHRDEIIEPGEFYFLIVNRFLFRGRLRPGQILTMRKGCLADVGDLVQIVHDDPAVCSIVKYQAGMEYTAVCVMVGTLEGTIDEQFVNIGKEFNYCRYTLNGVDRVTPRFYSTARAFDAMNILIDKYGCKAGVYGGHETR
ncbi:MAG: hypothetical protein PHF31_10040 [Methylobacter sp.]|nr:hypothetical protein [Methylobacter sp.]